MTSRLCLDRRGRSAGTCVEPWRTMSNRGWRERIQDILDAIAEIDAFTNRIVHAYFS